MTTGVSARPHLLAVLLAGLLFAAWSAPAADAAAARDVRCKRCVGAKDLGKRAVTSEKLAPRAVRGTHLARNAVSAVHVVDGSILASEIATGAVGAAEILDGAIGAADLAPGAVTSAAIADGTIMAVDLGFDVATQGELDAHVATAAHVVGERPGHATTIVEADNTAGGPDIAIGSDGLPIISQEDGNNQIQLIRCSDIACVDSTTRSAGSAASDATTTLMVGKDGLPVVVAENATGGVSLTHCDDLACATSTSEVVAATTLGGVSMTIGVNGFPYILHVGAGGELQAERCNDATCDSISSSTVSTSTFAVNSDVAIAVDGQPMYADQVGGTNNLRIHDCFNFTCSSAFMDEFLTANVDGITPSIVMASTGLAMIAHVDTTANGIKLLKCTDGSCTSNTQISVDIGGGARNPELFVGSDGLVNIVYDEANTLILARCIDLDCSAVRTVTVLSQSNVGGTPGVAVGVDGNPIIVHRDTAENDTLVTHCSNGFCIPHSPR